MNVDESHNHCHRGVRCCPSASSRASKDTNLLHNLFKQTHSGKWRLTNRGAKGIPSLICSSLVSCPPVKACLLSFVLICFGVSVTKIALLLSLALILPLSPCRSCQPESDNHRVCARQLEAVTLFTGMLRQQPRHDPCINRASMSHIHTQLCSDKGTASSMPTKCMILRHLGAGHCATTQCAVW